MSNLPKKQSMENKDNKDNLNENEKPNKDIDCDEVIRKLNMILDGEIAKEEETKLLHHIDDCQNCLEQYHIEKSFKELLKSKLQNMSVSMSLIQSIKDRIKGKT
ncbi:MAG: zf-HC2 domain-containing protein [Bacteroidia bacterium]|nr:zf-HC2 domain-containing protein [Bacteroidia bacterium]MDW8301584.1 zf-HC2 domain-containing protein [Bacteroidia bacterium]